jgi:hypothetical protein
MSKKFICDECGVNKPICKSDEDHDLKCIKGFRVTDSKGNIECGTQRVTFAENDKNLSKLKILIINFIKILKFGLSLNEIDVVYQNLLLCIENQRITFAKDDDKLLEIIEIIKEIYCKYKKICDKLLLIDEVLKRIGDLAKFIPIFVPEPI